MEIFVSVIIVQVSVQGDMFEFMLVLLNFFISIRVMLIRFRVSFNYC